MATTISTRVSGAATRSATDRVAVSDRVARTFRARSFAARSLTAQLAMRPPIGGATRHRVSVV